VSTLGVVEQEGAGEHLEDVARWPADPALLEANDVIAADVREPGKLLAAQPGDAAANAGSGETRARRLRANSPS
jgi:hypothetical protein